MPRLANALIFALFAVGCDAIVQPAPPPGPPPDPAAPGACESACARLQELACPAYTDDCVAACENIEELHRKGESELTLNPGCLAKIETCDEADAVCRD